MVKICIVYHSGYGHTAAQAKAVAAGVESVSGTEIKIFTVDQAENAFDELNSSDAIIFGSPTYMGSVSAPFKTFMDSSSKVWSDLKWKNKIAAGFTNSGSLSGDKLNTLIQLSIFAAQHSMIWVGTDTMPGNANSPESLNRIGSFLGAMAQSDHGSTTPSLGDLKTAELLGKRVALLTHQFVKGIKHN